MWLFYLFSLATTISATVHQTIKDPHIHGLVRDYRIHGLIKNPDSQDDADNLIAIILDAEAEKELRERKGDLGALLEAAGLVNAQPILTNPEDFEKSGAWHEHKPVSSKIRAPSSKPNPKAAEQFQRSNWPMMRRNARRRPSRRQTSSMDISKLIGRINPINDQTQFWNRRSTSNQGKALSPTVLNNPRWFPMSLLPPTQQLAPAHLPRSLPIHSAPAGLPHAPHVFYPEPTTPGRGIERSSMNIQSKPQPAIKATPERRTVIHESRQTIPQRQAPATINQVQHNVISQQSNKDTTGDQPLLFQPVATPIQRSFNPNKRAPSGIASQAKNSGPVMRIPWGGSPLPAIPPPSKIELTLQPPQIIESSFPTNRQQLPMLTDFSSPSNAIVTPLFPRTNSKLPPKTNSKPTPSLPLEPGQIREIPPPPRHLESQGWSALEQIPFQNSNKGNMHDQWSNPKEFARIDGDFTRGSIADLDIISGAQSNAHNLPNTVARTETAALDMNKFGEAAEIKTVKEPKYERLLEFASKALIEEDSSRTRGSLSLILPKSCRGSECADQLQIHEMAWTGPSVSFSAPKLRDYEENVREDFPGRNRKLGRLSRDGVEFDRSTAPLNYFNVNGHLINLQKGKIMLVPVNRATGDFIAIESESNLIGKHRAPATKPGAPPASKAPKDSTVLSGGSNFPNSDSLTDIQRSVLLHELRQSSESINSAFEDEPFVDFRPVRNSRQF